MATRAPSLPTKYLGHVHEAWYAALGDWQEQVADLVWPLSNLTYAQMRKDPQIQAVLTAYSLPIRRATWQVDPTGCRPEVAQLVADDLGLPVAGDDTPRAARVRGVSFADHLRSALLHLIYGHYGFEMLAKVDGNRRARLVGLSDRIPQTITWLHVSDQGDFLGISQDNRFFEEPPQIGADRLVWYVHDREGPMWQGRSLLRPSFAPWLLKRECQRILATSSQRFGMGVPTLRALSGTNPTPEQMHAAAAMAQQMRGGEQAGAAVPPGFVVELLGMQGGAPDTLAFIKWLDQQISRSALAQFLDLGGESGHGSRSLGQSFIDLFTLSITAVADYCADVLTRQVSARLVEWNWGEEEPVPAVVASDVGTKHEVTADAIQQLVSVGAIQPDPQLDAYLRQTFQLPKRDPSTPWQQPAPKVAATSAAPPPTVQVPTGDANVTAARPKRAPRRKTAQGQLTLPIAAADNSQDAKSHDDAATAAFAAVVPLLAPAVASLATEAAQLVESGQAGSLPTLAVGQTIIDQVAAALHTTMAEVADTSAQATAVEVQQAGGDVEPDSGDDHLLSQAASVAAALIAARLAMSAAQTAMTRTGGSRDQVETAVKADVGGQVSADTGWLAGAVSEAMLTADHQGRMATLAQADGQVRYRAAEEDDTASCQPCRDVSGTTYDTYTDVLADYLPGGGHIGCLGRGRCRGRVVPIRK